MVAATIPGSRRSPSDYEAAWRVLQEARRSVQGFNELSIRRFIDDGRADDLPESVRLACLVT